MRNINIKFKVIIVFIDVFIEVIRKTYNTRSSKMQGNFTKILWSDCDLHFQYLHICLFVRETAGKLFQSVSCIRYPLFCDVTLLLLVGSYRSLGTTCRFSLQGSRLCTIPEERRSSSHSGGNLKGSFLALFANSCVCFERWCCFFDFSDTYIRK